MADPEDFINKDYVYAVVGASKDPEKYGHKIFRDLKSAGYKVYAVNPNCDQLLGAKCYPELSALPEKPEVVDLVVPPKVAFSVLKSGIEQGIKKFWFQPGSESEEAIDYCREKGAECIYNMCIMVQRSSYE